MQKRSVRYQEKPKAPVYFNFDFDPEKITIKTEIPQLPEKFKSRPDEKNHQKKIKELEQKLQKLKEQRKKKKSQFKKFGLGFEQQIQKLENQIDLGGKCIKVLESDIQDIEKNTADLDEKIQKKLAHIRRLQRAPTKDMNNNTKNEKKDYQKMTYEQLEDLVEKLGIRVSTAALTKKQETEINALISKLNRLKMKAPHGQPIKNNDEEIEENQFGVERLRQIKKKQEAKITSLRYKIECIQEDIESFQEELDDIQEKKKNQEVVELKQQAKKLKDQIYKLRQLIAEQKQAFIDKQTEYEYQQKKIEWIKFATNTKQQRLKQWQQEKAERRKKKQFENKKKQKAEDAKQGEEKNKQEKTYERPKINRHQKQIDACQFLIGYCEQLYPKNKAQNDQGKKQKQSKDISTALKKGEWAKQKGIEVMKPKKVQQKVEKDQSTNFKRKKNKKQQQIEENSQNEQSSKFVHTVFIEQLFDSVKSITPTSVEDLDKLIQELKDKQEYYLAHPQGTENNSSYEKAYDRQKYVPEKYAKAKNNQNKKIINTEDFPSLN